MRVDESADVLGRSSGAALSERHHRTQVRLHGEYAPCVRQRRDGQFDLLLRLRRCLAAVDGDPSGAASAAVPYCLRYDHIPGLVLWSLIAARGAGRLHITSTVQRDGSKLSWNKMYGMQPFVGGWLGGILG